MEFRSSAPRRLAVRAAALPGAALSTKPPEPAAAADSAVNGNLTRDDAVKLAQAALEAHQVKGSPGLNAQNYGGFDHGDQAVVFEYSADRKVLNVLALCYRFRKPPRPGLLEAYHNEERPGTNTGGGTVEFRSDSGGLFPSRSYTQKTDPARFVEDIHKLMQAAKYWAEDVLPAVASKVFGHDR